MLYIFRSTVNPILLLTHRSHIGRSFQNLFTFRNETNQIKKKNMDPSPTAVSDGKEKLGVGRRGWGGEFSKRWNYPPHPPCTANSHAIAPKHTHLGMGCSGSFRAESNEIRRSGRGGVKAWACYRCYVCVISSPISSKPLAPIRHLKWNGTEKKNPPHPAGRSRRSPLEAKRCHFPKRGCPSSSCWWFHTRAA